MFSKSFKISAIQTQFRAKAISKISHFLIFRNVTTQIFRKKWFTKNGQNIENTTENIVKAVGIVCKRAKKTWPKSSRNFRKATQHSEKGSAKRPKFSQNRPISAKGSSIKYVRSRGGRGGTSKSIWKRIGVNFEEYVRKMYWFCTNNPVLKGWCDRVPSLLIKHFQMENNERCMVWL